MRSLLLAASPVTATKVLSHTSRTQSCFHEDTHVTVSDFQFLLPVLSVMADAGNDGLLLLLFSSQLSALLNSSNLSLLSLFTLPFTEILLGRIAFCFCYI